MQLEFGALDHADAVGHNHVVKPSLCITSHGALDPTVSGNQLVKPSFCITNRGVLNYFHGVAWHVGTWNRRLRGRGGMSDGVNIGVNN
jgi:hypothetical protein